MSGFARSGRRTTRTKKCSASRGSELVGRFPAWPISIEHERQHSGAGLYKKCLLLGGERAPHESDRRYAEGVKAEDRPISLDQDQMLGTGDTVQVEKNASLLETRAADRISERLRGSSSLAQRPVYATSTPRSSWIGMQIRPCMVPRLQYPRPNVAASSGLMSLPARYGCDGSSVSRNGSGRSGRSESSVAAVLRCLLPLRHRFVVPYPTHLFDTLCRLVDRYVLDLGDEVEHRALGAAAEAIEDLALEMDRAGWLRVRVEGTAAPCASLRRRGSLRRSGRGSARRMLLPSRERDTAAARS